MQKNSYIRVSSGAKWESLVGYSRAVKVGNQVEVAGTIALDKDGQVVAPGDPYLQTKRIIEIAESTLKKLGGKLENVIRTRIFTTDISKWEEIGKAHGEYFREIKPASTMVEISKLVIPETVVEIEFTAVID